MVIQQLEAECEDHLYWYVFDHLAEHDEAELVHGEAGLVGQEVLQQAVLLEREGLLHEFDDDEVGHVVVGEADEVTAHHVDQHVEVELVLELVDLLLQGQTQLLVLLAVLQQLLEFLLVYNFVCEQPLDERGVVLVAVDHVDLVLVDGREGVGDLLQGGVRRGGLCTLLEGPLLLVHEVFTVGLEHVLVREVSARMCGLQLFPFLAAQLLNAVVLAGQVGPIPHV